MPLLKEHPRSLFSCLVGMARPGKKAPKSASKPSFNTTAPTSPPASAVTSPPSPFELAPQAILPLADRLPKDHVFVLHSEDTPPGLRRQTFLVPILLNLMITAGLCLRLIYAAPVYLEQLITIFGYQTKWTVHPSQMPWSEIMNILAERTLLLSLDYVLFGLLGRWPWEFLFGDRYGRYVGTAGWKWNVGFSRKLEPIVRRGRKWDVTIFASERERKKQGRPEKSWTKEEELLVYTKCSEALRKINTSKNALTLLDKDWDLDYCAMVDAAELLDKDSIQFKDIDHVVLVYWNGRWYCWYLYTGSRGVEVNGGQDVKLEQFKKKLIEIGCEDVFYRWIEIIQYETNQSGALPAKKRNEAEQELRRMLKDRKKDDEAFMNSIGPGGVPGLDAQG